MFECATSPRRDNFPSVADCTLKSIEELFSLESSKPRKNKASKEQRALRRELTAPHIVRYEHPVLGNDRLAAQETQAHHEFSPSRSYTYTDCDENCNTGRHSRRADPGLLYVEIRDRSTKRGDAFHKSNQNGREFKG